MNKINIKNTLPILLLLVFSNPVFALDNYELVSGKWRLISLPLDPGVNNSVNDIFGDDINAAYGTEWLIYGYDSVGKTYQSIGLDDSLKYGVGYWILQITGENVQLDMPANSVEATVVPLMVSTEREKSQWSLSGYPLSIAKKFSDLVIKTSSGKCADKGCDPNEANLQKIFHNEVWRLSQDDAVQYEKVSGDTKLNPWDGFWCVTLEDANKVSPVDLTTKYSNRPVVPPIPGNWVLSFSDDFNGTSLDPNNWRLGEHFLGINGKAGNSAKHTIVRNGKLELIAEKTPLKFAGEDYEYSAGEITTFQKHRQLYGYFESRIKYDAVRGVWPAFWTMPDRGYYGREEFRKESYIRFNLDSVTQPVSKALLKVKIKSIEKPNNRSNITFYKLLTNDWSEQTINWGKRPAYDPVWLQQFTGTQEDNNEIVVGQDLIVDVTDYINNQIASSKRAGFAIADTFRFDNGITFGSRESSDPNERPRLEIEGSDIFPSADAYVNAGSLANNNYGGTDLVVKEPWKNTSSVADGGMEIDIMESLGIWGEDKTQHALHWDRYGQGHPMVHSDGAPLTLEPTSDGYHVYGMYWEPGRITFYVDGKETWKYENARVGNIASYILLSHQLGGWSGNSDIDDANFPATMYVDYVYTWEGTPTP